MMNKRLLLTIFLSLALCNQPIQAASYYTKKVLSGAIALGYWGMLYKDQAIDHKQFYDDVRDGEQDIKQNPELYHVTDPEILALIHDQVKKKGFDPAQISVVKNVGPGVGIKPTHENLVSLGTTKSFLLKIGDETHTDYLPYYKEKWQIPVLQHELGHAQYKHALKKIGYELFIPIVAHMMSSRLLAIPYQLVGIAHIIKLSSWWPSLQKLCLLPTTLITTENIDTLWFDRFKPMLSRYYEKQADLSIDNDPKIIYGMINQLQNEYDTLVTKHGKEAVEAYLRQKERTHPHPLDRIAYLTEKLNEARRSAN